MPTPEWPGAAAVYSRAYRVLERMAPSHVTRVRVGRGRFVCSPSEDMRRLIDALNSGGEETIKGLLLMPHVYA